MAELKQGSRLALLDEANLKLRLQITLSDSVAYSILKRCGVPNSVLEDTIGFMYIPEFDTPDTLLALGNNISELAKPVLMEIGKCIWAFDREQEKLKAQEKAQNQTRETSPCLLSWPLLFIIETLLLIYIYIFHLHIYFHRLVAICY